MSKTKMLAGKKTRARVAAVAAGLLSGAGLFGALGGTAAAAPPDTFRHYGNYQNEGGCKAEGDSGQRAGVWSHYYCSYNYTNKLYELWVNDVCVVCRTPEVKTEAEPATGKDQSITSQAAPGAGKEQDVPASRDF